MRAALVTLLVGAALALPAGALAQAPVPTLRLTLEQVGGQRLNVVAGERFRVRGLLAPAAGGEAVTVSAWRGTRQVSARTVRVGRGGVFVARLRAAGRSSSGSRPARRRPWRARSPCCPSPWARDSPRRAVRALQVRLARLGYVAGRFDARTGRAVLAFRKVTGMARLPVASQPVMRALALGRGAWAVRFRRHGRHVEADLGRQVLALIGRGGRVLAIYPTSPGTPTIRGSFRVYRKDRGTNAIGMVHSSYFRGGYAVHGYPSVPTYNASHGCLRVPVPDALRIFRWMRMGTRVDVYA